MGSPPVYGPGTGKLTENIARACASRNEQLVCLSVRSGFDLLLQALALPAGSEILVSAVTHPDMVNIIERHDLRAVPVDLDLATLAPRAEAIRVVEAGGRSSSRVGILR